MGITADKAEQILLHQFSAVPFCTPGVLSENTFHIDLQFCAHVHQIARKSNILYRRLIALHMRDNRFIAAGQYIVYPLTDMLCGISLGKLQQNIRRTGHGHVFSFFQNFLKIHVGMKLTSKIKRQIRILLFCRLLQLLKLLMYLFCRCFKHPTPIMRCHNDVSDSVPILHFQHGQRLFQIRCTVVYPRNHMAVYIK